MSADAAPARRDSFVPPGETILADVKPNLLFIVLGPLGWILATVLLTTGAVWALALPGAPVVSVANVILLGAAVVVFRIFVETLDWAMRRYTLTDRRVLAIRGILRRYTTDIPLERVQHLTLFRSIRERLVGAGTIGIATAGTAGVEMFWIRVSDYDRLMQLIRDAAARASPRGSTPASPTPAPPTPTPAPLTPLILGLVGGVGAGKSTVAAALARAGFVVADSDREAKDALLRPEVRETLLSWWGPRILESNGQIDRKAIADIIFNSPQDRLRLEGLIHPLLGHTRPELLARAAAATARGTVVDAPLLLEAGLDRECDAVIFVDAARELRLRRVRETRGWSEEELDRRERAQLPLDEKRRRAAFTVTNEGDQAALDAQVAQLLRQLAAANRPADAGRRS